MAHFPRRMRGNSTGKKKKNLNEAGKEPDTRCELAIVVENLPHPPTVRPHRLPSPLSLQADHLEKRAGNTGTGRGLLPFSLALKGRIFPKL